MSNSGRKCGGEDDINLTIGFISSLSAVNVCNTEMNDKFMRFIHQCLVSIDNNPRAESRD